MEPDRYGPLHQGPRNAAVSCGGPGWWYAGPATCLAEGETLGHTSPHFLADGRHFVFLAPNLDERKSAVFLGSLDSFDRKLLLMGASEIEYAAPDYLLFLRNGVVLAQRFDFGGARPAGPARAIYDGPGRNYVVFGIREWGVVPRV